MSWTPEDMAAEAEVSIWLVQQKRQRRKRMAIGAGAVFAVLFVTWLFAHVMGVANKHRIQYEQWLENNGCHITSKKDSEWKYHLLGDYWERIPGEVCYKCSKTGESFCKDT
jgi:hypothetical protein